MTATIKTCEAQEAWRAFQEGRGVLVDVRESAEYAARRVEGSLNAPLSALAGHAPKLGGKPLYLLCRSGMRSEEAARTLECLRSGELFIVQGGLLAWEAAELPVRVLARAPWSIERQVRGAAGSLVLSGVLLGWLWRPAFYALAGFVGAGLVFSALTDTCGMAWLLLRMPWNKKRGACG